MADSKAVNNKCPFFYDNGQDGTNLSTDAVKQVYTIVNEAAKQAVGCNAITAIDTRTFVDLGKQITAADIVADSFYKALTLMAANTIIAYRPYRSHEDLTELSAEEYGAWVRKISFKMPEAKSDDSVVLENGKSVDMYTVNMPDVVQKVYGKIVTWSYYITTQTAWLKLAFESERKMSQFLAGIMGSVENEMALNREDTARLTRNTYIAAIGASSREIKLVTNYNAETGKALTATNCVYDAEFLRYALSVIETTSDDMTYLRADFNDGTVLRHTPVADQRLYMESSFMNSISTQALYSAFNEQYLKIMQYRKIPFWQSPKNRREVMIQTGETGETVTVSNVVGLLFDRDAIGSYRHVTESYTTPINARGRYTNTFWFVNYQPINDMSENAVIFTLN